MTSSAIDFLQRFVYHFGMDQNIKQNIPLAPIIIGFVILMLLSSSTEKEA